MNFSNMSTQQSENFSANVQAFVPRDMPHQVQQQSSFTPTHQKVSQYHGSPTSHYASAQASIGGFSDYSSHMVSAMKHQQKRPQQTSGAFTPNHTLSHQVYQPTSAQGQPTHFVQQGHQPNYVGGYAVGACSQFQQPQVTRMPEFKMNFHCATQTATQHNFLQPGQASFLPPSNTKHSRKVLQSVKMAVLPLGKVQQQAYYDASSPVTNSTAISSQNSHFSDDDMTSEMGGFDSPVSNITRKQTSQTVVSSPQSNMKTANIDVVVKTENGWKRKVRTELCSYWLRGQDCENRQKDQGCGFAHGSDELQKKRGLSRQYLTSVCKNFLDHPSKCTYGQRCIFQHPTHDVRTRQNYTSMIQDNARYTAMRLFQDIEGSEIIYINTYAATAPRLAAFREICNSTKDGGENPMDSIDDVDEAEISSVPVFSRDQFHNDCQQ